MWYGVFLYIYCMFADAPQPSTFSGATAGPSSYSNQPPSQPSPPYPPPGNQLPGGAQSWPQEQPQASYQPPPPQPQYSAPQETWKPPSNPSESILSTAVHLRRGGGVGGLKNDFISNISFHIGSPDD